MQFSLHLYTAKYTAVNALNPHFETSRGGDFCELCWHYLNTTCIFKRKAAELHSVHMWLIEMAAPIWGYRMSSALLLHESVAFGMGGKMSSIQVKELNSYTDCYILFCHIWRKAVVQIFYWGERGRESVCKGKGKVHPITGHEGPEGE